MSAHQTANPKSPNTLNVSKYRYPVPLPDIEVSQGNLTLNTSIRDKYSCTGHDQIKLTEYIKSFLSNKQEINIFGEHWNRWKLIYESKIRNINDLPTDILRNIVSYSTLTEYAFTVLQVNKHFHKVLSPQSSPHIMRQLLWTNWDRRLEFPLTKKEGLPAYANFWAANPRDLCQEWEIIGTFAWQNTKRIQYETMEQILAIINKDRLKHKAYYSSLFLLHFLYKCRYGGISKTVELKELIYQLISNGGGLGLGYMVAFYYNEFFRSKYKIHGQDKIAKERELKRLYNDGTVHRFFRSIYFCSLSGVKLKSKYSLWTSEQIIYNLKIWLFHSLTLFDIYKIYSDESYNEIYRK